MKYFLSALLFILYLNSSNGQTSVSHLSEYSIQIWSTEEGLPSNNLRTIVQDNKGYIWITSFNGLMRFDGHTFDVFGSEQLPGLKSNGFSTIAEDIEGNMYYGTLTSGLLKYDGLSFELFEIEDAFSKSISANIVDSKGQIWVGTKGQGVYYFDMETSKFKVFNSEQLKNTSVSSILELDNGNLWFATEEKGIIVYNGKTFSTLDLVDLKTLRISSVKEHDSKIFIGTEDGVYSYENGVTHQIEGTKGYIVNYLEHDLSGNLWVATEAGLIRVLPSGSAEYLSEIDGLPSRQVSSLLTDSENNIWLATKRGGLAVLRQSNFVNISREDGLSNQFVNTIAQLDGGVMAIGSDNGEIDLIKHNQIRKFKLKTDLTNISVKDILEDRNGNIWLATYLGVLIIKDEEEELLTVADGMPSNSPRCIYEDDNGSIWIGFKSAGIVRFDPDGSRKRYSVENGMSDNYVLSIDQLPNGDILVGTYQGGLNIISSSGEIAVLTIGSDGSSPLIFNIEVVNNDVFWLATDVGLYKYYNGNFYKIEKGDGLGVSTIFDVHIDDYGYMWLTSNQGIVRLKKENADDFVLKQISQVTARLYDERDGMLSRECTGATKLFISPTGNIWIPTSKGISVVDPGEISINEKIPPVYIKSILVNDELHNGRTDKIILDPGTQRLTINYTALSFYSPAQINFKYRLKGFEKEWNEVGNKYQATYMNLPGGNFTFEVIAANNDGVWNEMPATIEIQLEPFFYTSRLFYLILAAFFLVVTFIIYWIRIRVVEEKNRELHKLNEELDSFVYSVSHDLRAPLTSILGLISISKIEGEEASLPSYLSKIETSVNKLDDFIKEIISYSRNVRLKVELEEVNVKEMVDEVLEGLAYMNVDDTILVNVKAKENGIVNTDKTRLRVILNNILSNAFRYYKSYINDSFIDIKIITNSSGATITVEDNGIGIKPDRLKRVFDMFYRATDASVGSGLGLYIAKESIIKLEGTLEVESEYERGTTFTITIPDL